MSEPSYQEFRLFYAFVFIGIVVRVGAVSHEKFLPDQDSSPVRFLIESIRQRDPFSPNSERIHIGVLHHIQNPGCTLRLITVCIPLHRIHAAAPESHLFPIDQEGKRHRHLYLLESYSFLQAIHDLLVLPLPHDQLQRVQVLQAESSGPPEGGVFHRQLPCCRKRILRCLHLHDLTCHRSTIILQHGVHRQHFPVQTWRTLPGDLPAYLSQMPLLLQTCPDLICRDSATLPGLQIDIAIHAHRCKVRNCSLIPGFFLTIYHGKIMQGFSEQLAFEHRIP